MYRRRTVAVGAISALLTGPAHARAVFVADDGAQLTTYDHKE